MAQKTYTITLTETQLREVTQAAHVRLTALTGRLRYDDELAGNERSRLIVNADALAQSMRLFDESPANGERKLSDAEVEELLVGVSTAKLERLLRERNGERGENRPHDSCAFPGCTVKRPFGDLFCLSHQDDDEAALI